MDGVIVIDKPEGWTSHDVVNKVRRIAKTKKVGHLGTLDPIATGVLPLVIERATRLAQFYTRSEKIYEGLVRFGWSTSSYDRAGEPTSEKVEVQLTAEQLEHALENFRGEFLQRPPAVSAKKVEGKRSYELARKNMAVELEPVKVHVYELTLLALEGNLARLRAHCSGGTYMRSIAHDLGQALGCGAHLQELRRLASGEFELDQARTLEQLESLAAEDRLPDAIVPAGKLLPAFPSVFVDEITAAQIRNGRDFPASPFRSQPASKYVKAVTRTGDLVAIGEVVLPNLYHPTVVM
uniref:tRNA pseudouridine synthase B n=1 Tax=Solibacter usitatus (strain Ellin6076) TaxID=234267 RepID=TRUB_SOLUE|nr:RecName: Full=tRNA pseudouridine synthase B; AltName: Full=tRNA pseudouridine(55) synthase; Short=Psi55 synthase; AltName: Full=tRNA pseudouridylate synthase; AltName: Full=tRNA-uridine isomerase [Candidatus Solibacter usitatus Ellin6076]